MTTEERFDRIESALYRMANTLETVVDNQKKFDTVLSVLAESQIKLAEQTATLERQWQAYINTIRPQ